MYSCFHVWAYMFACFHVSRLCHRRLRNIVHHIAATDAQILFVPFLDVVGIEAT